MSAATTSGTVAGLPHLLTSWRRHLRAANLSPRTIQNYLEAAEQLVDYLCVAGAPTDPATVTRGQVEAFIGSILDRHSASTAGNRYRALQQLFRWLVDEDEITTSPMHGMRPPRVPEQPVSIFQRKVNELEALTNVRSFAAVSVQPLAPRRASGAGT